MDGSIQQRVWFKKLNLTNIITQPMSRLPPEIWYMIFKIHRKNIMNIAAKKKTKLNNEIKKSFHLLIHNFLIYDNSNLTKIQIMDWRSIDGTEHVFYGNVINILHPYWLYYRWRGDRHIYTINNRHIIEIKTMKPNFHYFKLDVTCQDIHNHLKFCKDIRRYDDYNKKYS